MIKDKQKQLKKAKKVQQELQNELQYIESVEEILNKEDEKTQIRKIRNKL